MKLKTTLQSLLTSAIAVATFSTTATAQQLTPVDIQHVTIKDAFWSPKLNTIHIVTVYDVLNKLEGNYEPTVKT
ncbi:hypothetical protein SAMN05192574_107149 [Mucilaginibacter gossypiicola]|uniref:Uncharacterized protein n=1 Tax=Mucilaginibacter gossypiicola TaxID=551995 RepID=A0A1H8NY03_9SPHI|nr:hypothetical protein [Mucilaginibacter gossypiicola]SEO34526.1 hypothetical protein SAMN05192574_107149 [Mucilaginibacter gossypiicola]